MCLRRQQLGVRFVTGTQETSGRPTGTFVDWSGNVRCVYVCVYCTCLPLTLYGRGIDVSLFGLYFQSKHGERDRYKTIGVGQ